MTEAVWSALGFARDGALVLLALEAIVLLAVPLLLVFYVTKWLHRVIPQVAKVLRQAQEVAVRWQALLVRVTVIIRTPFVFLISLYAVLKAAAAALQRWWHLGGES